jgi:transcriptional regulator with XRE-family HTH domain
MDINSIMVDNVETAPDVDQRIARRVRALRADAALSLEDLASRSGVSRSMISLIERGETSATAVLLEKLASGLGVLLSALFETGSTGNKYARGPLARRAHQPLWKDPASGYLRRSVTPADCGQPMRIVEVSFPAGQRVAFDNEGRDASVCQQVWMLEGRMELTVGRELHRLEQGDCLAMRLDQPILFRNPTRRTARYAVVIAAGGRA